MSRPVAMLAMVLLSSLSIGWSKTNSPTWVGERQDPRLWSHIRNVLKDDLEPEDPKKTAPYVAMRFKYVARVAPIEGVALVIVGMRETGSPPGLDYFKAYNIDLKASVRSPVANEGFWRWRFLQWAQFERGRLPDAVFRFQSCTECEATYLLGSFWFDSAKKRWKLREWPEDGTSIVIGSDIQFGEEDDFATTCLYAVRDYTGDGSDDIVTWCRTTGVKTGKVTGTLFLYTASEAGQRRIEPGGEAAARIKHELCRKNSANALCR